MPINSSHRRMRNWDGKTLWLSNDEWRRGMWTHAALWCEWFHCKTGSEEIVVRFVVRTISETEGVCSRSSIVEHNALWLRTRKAIKMHTNQWPSMERTFVFIGIGRHSLRTVLAGLKLTGLDELLHWWCGPSHSLWQLQWTKKLFTPVDVLWTCVHMWLQSISIVQSETVEDCGYVCSWWVCVCVCVYVESDYRKGKAEATLTQTHTHTQAQPYIHSGNRQLLVSQKHTPRNLYCNICVRMVCVANITGATRALRKDKITCRHTDSHIWQRHAARMRCELHTKPHAHSDALAQSRYDAELARKYSHNHFLFSFHASRSASSQRSSPTYTRKMCAHTLFCTTTTRPPASSYPVGQSAPIPLYRAISSCWLACPWHYLAITGAIIMSDLLRTQFTIIVAQLSRRKYTHISSG